MSLKDTVSIVYYVCAIVGVVGVVGKLCYSWFRGDQISKKFIIDTAEEHLPYIYRELRFLNPGAPEHPHISFSHFKEK